MNISKPVARQLDRTSFGFYRPDEVRALSVKSIWNPVPFDAHNHPNRGSIYDPALGALDKNSFCSTCSLNYFQCPGHFGHIDMPLPVYNPMFFKNMFNLLKATCFFCFKLRANKVTIALYEAKLLLLSYGMVVQANNLEDYVTRSGLTPEDGDADGDEAVEDNSNCQSLSYKQSETLDRIQDYVNAALQQDPSLSGCIRDKNYKCTLSVKTRRDLARNLIKDLMAATKCTNCGAYPIQIRQFNNTKVFASSHAQKPQTDSSGKRLRFSEESVYRHHALIMAGKEAAKNKYDDEDSDSEEAQERGLSSIINPSDEDAGDHARRGEQYINPSTVMTICQLLWHHNGEFLDVYLDAQCTDKLGRDEKVDKSSLFQMLFFEVVGVPPIRFRPPSVMGEMTFEHPQNTFLGQLLKGAQSIRDFTKLLSSNDTIIEERDKLLSQLNDAWLACQAAVNGMVGVGQASNDPKAPTGVQQLLEKKEGLFRKHMMGKRVNYAARSVISPDPWIEPNEIGLPPVFAKKLTFPEPVTGHNVKRLMQNVINGPDIIPGATHIELEDGQLQALHDLNLDQRTALAAKLLIADSTHLGGDKNRAHINKKVYRHVMNGDVLLVNRQPTLHKPSIMAHKARVLPGQRTLRLHYANCNTYNADFDGDEMNVHFPQNEIARAEAYNIAATQYQYLVPTDGSPLRGLIQDHIISGVRLSMRSCFLEEGIFQQLLLTALPSNLLAQGSIFIPVPAIVKPKPFWTGKQLISALLRNLFRDQTPFTLTSKAKLGEKLWGKQGAEEAIVHFCQGDFVTGVLDKSQIGASAFGIVHSVYELYGSASSERFLGCLSRLFSRYLQMFAFSCRVDDLLLTPAGNSWRDGLFKDAVSAGTDVAMQLTKTTNARDLKKQMEEFIREDDKLEAMDAAMKSKMNGVTSSVISTCLPKGLLRPFPANGMQLMTTSGAKGSNVNVSQISCCLGQQELEGRRVPIMVSGKTLPSFAPFETHARSGGFVSGRFLTGVSPHEYYFHCMAGREGLIDTAVKTSRSGYLQRCLMKHLEGLRVQYDGTVRDADGSLLQFLYGEDGLDVIKSKHLGQFNFCAENYQSIRRSCVPETLEGKLDEEAADKARKRIAKKNLSETTNSLLSPYTHHGSTSESFNDKLQSYMDKNPQSLLYRKRKKQFNNTVSKDTFNALMRLKYMRSLVDPGEAVGVIAAQSIGEPSTQMTLNTFHFAGFGAKNVTLGIPRLREIVMTASAHIKTPAMTLTMNKATTSQQRDALTKKLSKLELGSVTKGFTVREMITRVGGSRQRKYQVRLEFFDEADYRKCHDVDFASLRRIIQRHTIVRLDHLLKQSSKKRAAPGDEILESIDMVADMKGNDGADDDEAIPNVADKDSDRDYSQSKYEKRQKQASSYESDSDEDTNDDDDEDSKSMSGAVDERQSGRVDHVVSPNLQNMFMTDFTYDDVNGAWVQFNLTIPGCVEKPLMVGLIEEAISETVIRQVPHIDRCYPVEEEPGAEVGVLKAGTDGVNLAEIWNYADLVDVNSLYTNDVSAVLKLYGVEAARTVIMKEIAGVFDVYGISVDKRHLTVIADYMTFEGSYKPFNRIGMNSNPSPFLQMSYETTCGFLTSAVTSSDHDNLTSPSARIVVGRVVEGGTGCHDVMQRLM